MLKSRYFSPRLVSSYKYRIANYLMQYFGNTLTIDNLKVFIASISKYFKLVFPYKIEQLLYKYCGKTLDKETIRYLSAYLAGNIIYLRHDLIFLPGQLPDSWITSLFRFIEYNGVRDQAMAYKLYCYHGPYAGKIFDYAFNPKFLVYILRKDLGYNPKRFKPFYPVYLVGLFFIADMKKGIQLGEYRVTDTIRQYNRQLLSFRYAGCQIRSSVNPYVREFPVKYCVSCRKSYEECRLSPYSPRQVKEYETIEIAK